MNKISTSNPVGERVIVGMSGGVDSSVAALLLLRRGFEVEGLFMKNWEEDDTATYCSAADDLRDAQGVCDKLGIALHTVNFSTEYWDRVFERFLAEYRAGRTPNPDVLCNKEIKFRAFLEHARFLGADSIATGHYARIKRGRRGLRLLRGLDLSKDQSYFLYMLDQSQLVHALFPLGNLTKVEVRRLAEAAGLDNHAKRDSTGICFIGERRFYDFLSRYLAAAPGAICTPDGTQVGEHSGLWFYTIGQRQGLGIGRRRGGAESPWYVADKDFQANRLIVAQGHDHPLLWRRRLLAGQFHWVAQSPLQALNEPADLCAKIRYRQREQSCAIKALQGERLLVIFDEPQWAAAPGQAIVFYRGEECLGGGVIDDADTMAEAVPEPSVDAQVVRQAALT